MKRVLPVLLILALLVCCLPVMSVRASAEQYGTYLYNGQEFPDINSVWTDKETYPYALITRSNNTLWLLTAVPYWFYDYSKNYYYGFYLDGNSRVSYKLSDDGTEWSYSNKQTSTSAFFYWTQSNILWASFDILNSSGSVYLAASDPVATGATSPTIPVCVSDLNGQTISMDLGDTLTFYVLVGNCNGTPACEWYINGYAYDEVFDFVALENASYDYIQAWSYTPGEAGTRILRCDVTNTYGEASETVTAGYVTVVVGGDTSGDGSGSDTDSEIIGALDTIETDMAVMQESIDSVSEQVGAVQDQLEGVQGAVEELPDEIVGGISDYFDQQQDAAQSQGNDSADELIDAIPDPSQGFLSALGDLVSVLSYDGTEAVISTPEIYIPAIDGLFPQIHLLDPQELDFEYYFTLLPEVILLLIRALFDAAIVSYCLKELMELIGSFANGFANIDKAVWED